MLLGILLGGCLTSNDCLDMCQSYELHLEDCGYGWSTRFEDEGWTSIEDCYDAHWEPTNETESWCRDESDVAATAACY